MINYYKDDNNFIIKIKSKDEKEDMYLAKLENPKNIKFVLESIRKEENLRSINSVDEFECPNIQLNV